MSEKIPDNVDKSCGCLIEDILTESEDSKCSRQPENSDYNKKESIMVDPDVEKISLDYYQKKFTDGLPIIPPTPDRVNKFYQYSKGDPQEVLAILPPLQGKATREKIAVNGVMAGCLPQFMPLLEKAVMGLGDEKFNLAGVNATTHPVAVCTLINGPVRNELEFNSKTGCLGPGNLANASIGRAIRFVLMNIAGAVPGIGDHATMGSASKYSYCFAENEEESPWDALHVERGYASPSGTLTLLGMEAPHNVNDHRSQKAEDLLDSIVHTASTAGCNNSHVPGELLVIMSPEHARTISNEGWGKKDVKKYIHQHAMVPVNLADRGGRKLDEIWCKENMVPITRKIDDVVIVVAGGPGRHTMLAHGFGTSCESVTLPLD
ncbi:hypothetical protein JCM15415_09390 [Methanobacterium movens]